MRRRRKDHDADVVTGDPAAPDAEGVAVPSPEAVGRGPWDAGDRPVDEDDETRAHLGSLSVPGHPEVELRLQVEETTGSVAAVVMVTPEGALEMRPFAASRNHDMWADVLPRIRDDIARQGGQAEEVEGPYGPALRTVIGGKTPEGETVRQPALLLGVNGPRWLLRVTAYGRPATQWQEEGLLEKQLADVVVL